MTKLARIGIDTSKSVFQLHGVDEKEQAVLRKQLRRRQFVVSSPSWNRPWSVWRRVVLPTTGLVSCSSWATR